MLPCYLINLDRDQMRLRLMQDQLDRLQITFRRIRAVDGLAMDDVALQAFADARPLKRTLWGRGQAACFLSHFHVWEQIAQTDEAYAVVFEDDLILSQYLPEILSDATWIPAECDIIRLEPSTNAVLLASPILQKENFHVQKLRSTSWCTGGYILKRETARRLTAVPPDLHERVDAFLFSLEISPTARLLKSYQLSPAVCVQGKFTGSTNPAFRSNIEPTAEILKVKRNSFRASGLLRRIHGYRKIRFKA